ncbi:hypothetical protein [Alkalihalobacterium elongatum]|uniref:hypothetical protein n=1 Tax=Alkalihalobacterium elongatum TaxID=2675466 RepID=UPI001C1FFCEF|nr:hypothetical protein [Alkalihalobacterium elongatum]
MVVTNRINVGVASSQANRLNTLASQLKDLNKSLESIKTNLKHGWQAKEITYINNAIASITKEIHSLSSELNSIGSDVVSVALEISREEQAKIDQAKREAEARAKAKAEKG